MLSRNQTKRLVFFIFRVWQMLLAMNVSNHYKRRGCDNQDNILPADSYLIWAYDESQKLMPLMAIFSTSSILLKVM